MKIGASLGLAAWAAAFLGCASQGGSGASGNMAAAGGSAPGIGGTSGGNGGAPVGGSAGVTSVGGSGAGAGMGGSGAGMGGSGAAGGGAGGTLNGGAGSGGTGGDACASALFCEDFESYTPAQAPGGMWQAVTNGGSVTIESGMQVSGSQAAVFRTEAGSNSKTAYLHLEDATVFPVAGNAYYGRFMFRLESAPTEAVHWTILQGGGLVPGQTYRALYRYGGQHPVTGGNQLMANYETPDSYSGNGPASDCWHHANGTVVPEGVWTCMEWHFDGSSNSMRLWLNGEAKDDLTVMGTGQGCVSSETSTWTAPTFEYLELGWESYQPDDARTLYIDDLVISEQPIGCPD